MLSSETLCGSEVVPLKCGYRVCFHGAFGSKAKAVRKERRVKGGFIRPITVRGQRRFVVMGRREK